MNHPDRHIAKRYDTPNRSRRFTDIVYTSGAHENPGALWDELHRAERSLDLPAPDLIPLVGEMHGHSCFSDGGPTPEAYFANIRDLAKLDFAVLTDHDHGGVGSPELWAESPSEGSPSGESLSKWELTRRAALAARVEGKFSTLLGYERDSYPFYNNMILYFRDDSCAAEMVRGVRDGEITAEELRALLAREDIVTCPHDTYSLSSGADFGHIPVELITPYIEIMSRGDAAEYMGNPALDQGTVCEGGFWQDALRRGAKIGVIGGSDDHGGMNGRVNHEPYPFNYPGVTGVWATENTPAAIFDALKAGRTYAFMRGPMDGAMEGRMVLDLRIEGRYVGETITRPENGNLHLYFCVQADTPIKQVTLVKNCRNIVTYFHRGCEFRDSILDYRQETPCDCYYLRVELTDGRFGWTSPIWVEA